MMKLSDNMARTLAVIADQGSLWMHGRDVVSVRALESRGLVTIVKTRRVGVESSDGKPAVRVEITDAGFELAVELV